MRLSTPSIARVGSVRSETPRTADIAVTRRVGSALLNAQCAAVTTQLGATSEPVQIVTSSNVPSLLKSVAASRNTVLGHALCGAGVPPTMRAVPRAYAAHGSASSAATTNAEYRCIGCKLHENCRFAKQSVSLTRSRP